MEQTLARNWKWIALRGVIAIVFGLLTLTNPLITISALVLLFGAYALVDGVFSVISAIANRKGERQWVAILIGGIAGIIIGVGTFAMPAITATVLLIFIAAWAIAIGIAQIVAAVRLRKVITGEWMLAFAGAVSILFGIFLIARPAVGALAVVFWIGIYAVVSGIVLILLAFKLRSWDRQVSPAGQPRAA